MTVLRDEVVKRLVELTVRGDQDGLIPGFNVLVNQLPVAFWNTFTDRILAAAAGNEQQSSKVKNSLYQCAYECGYHTGYGIVTSEEFKAVVEPMVTEGAKDILRGAYAVFTAWGWAKSGIVQIHEGEKMVIRAVDYYEADGQKGELRAFMISGVSAAFFELAYAKPYPDGMNTYKCVQNLGIEAGDNFGEFVVTRK